MKLFLCLVFTLVSTISCDTDPDGPIVKTDAGVLRGLKRISSVTNQTIYSFQGIRYAAPPVGKLRFEPPQSYKWDGVYPATQEGSPCIQSDNNGQTIDSEDCLFMNIYSPDIKRIDLPVIVYIYGGGYTVGSASSSAFLSPDLLVGEDVIFVNFGYRLGIFGFITTGDRKAPGNGGLKDQIFALKWVRKNIRKFGGDPFKVTIMGESAGAMSVSWLMQSLLTAGLFRAAIMQSGSSLSPWAHSKRTKELTYDIARTLNIDNSTSENLVEGLKSVDANKLQNVAYRKFQEYFRENPLYDRVIAPVIEPIHPGAVITRSSIENLKIGRFERVPCLMGFNSNEGVALSLTLEYLQSLKAYASNEQLFVPLDKEIKSGLDKTILGNHISKKYFQNGSILNNIPKAEMLFGDVQFAYPIWKTGFLQSRFVPVYFYQLSFKSAWGQFISGQSTSYEGVGHMEDLAYLFYSSLIKYSPPNCILTRNRMVRLWTNFVKYREPTRRNDLVLNNLIWPSVKTNNFSYLDINSELTIQTNPKAEIINFWDDIFK